MFFRAAAPQQPGAIFNQLVAVGTHARCVRIANRISLLAVLLYSEGVLLKRLSPLDFRSCRLSVWHC